MRTCNQTNRGRIFRGGRIVRGRGGSLIETALVLPVLLYLAMGTVEFGYYFYVRSTLQSAAREGARAGICATAVQTDVTTAVDTFLQSVGIAKSMYTTTTTPSDISTAKSPASITVQIQAIWGTIGAGYNPLRLIGSTNTVTVKVIMMKES